MNLKIVPFLAAAILAVSAPSLADEFDDFDNDATTTSVDDSGDGSYDGSAASEFADDADYAADFNRYKKEKTSKAEINRQRTEGFARTILLGVRGAAGINTFFGTETEGWVLGAQGEAGLMVQLPLGVKNMNIVPELVFNYRHYSYDTDTEFGTNDASIDIILFEIPVIVRYTFVDYGMFVGLGLNLGLKLSGSSEFNQNMDMGESMTRSNTIATTGFELGAALDLGYMLTRYVHANIRVVQGFTNLLNQTLNAETGAFGNSMFLTFYATAGVSFMF